MSIIPWFPVVDDGMALISTLLHVHKSESISWPIAAFVAIPSIYVHIAVFMEQCTVVKADGLLKKMGMLHSGSQGEARLNSLWECTVFKKIFFMGHSRTALSGTVQNLQWDFSEAPQVCQKDISYP